ncbi:MAG: MerR family transcriptional regulator [Chloroflexota bacterium]
MNSNLTTKQFSEKTGISIDTLRYYERIGLIDPVERAPNGHRCYGERDLRRVDFLKRVRATGMSISEMQRYVDLFRMGDSTIAERRMMLEHHRQVVQEQIRELYETMALLDTKISGYVEQEQVLHLYQNIDNLCPEDMPNNHSTY